MATPTPINFAIAPALRSGNFQSPQATYAGGYSSLNFSLTGLGTGPGSDYENTANSVSIVFWIQPPGQNGFSPSYGFSWQGGHQLGRDGTIDPPPSLSTSLANLPAGSLYFIQVSLTGTFTVGVTGAIS